MPLKGIILILLIAILIALLLHEEIYTLIKKYFSEKKDEDNKDE